MVLEREIPEQESVAKVVLREGRTGPPATEAQLIRIGRRLGLRYEEAEALLEVLGAEPADGEADEDEGDVALRSFSPQVMARLRATPGLFLLTDGMTFGRLERAVSRVRGLKGARRRLRHLGAAVERAAAFEGRLLQQAARALRRGAGAASRR